MDTAPRRVPSALARSAALHQDIAWCVLDLRNDRDDDVLELPVQRGDGFHRVLHPLEQTLDELPIADEASDVVVLSLLLHHLAPANKAVALLEARRVLRPGGALHVADWGRRRDLQTAAGFLALRWLDGFENTRDHGAGRLPRLIREAGFASISARQRLRTPWGSLAMLEAERPATVAP